VGGGLAVRVELEVSVVVEAEGLGRLDVVPGPDAFVEVTDVDELVIVVVGAAAEEVCFEPPQPASSREISGATKTGAKRLTFPA
jgi:hypothetical protein